MRTQLTYQILLGFLFGNALLTHAVHQQVCLAITAGVVPMATSAGYHYYRSYVDPRSTSDTFKPFMVGLGCGAVPLVSVPLCAARALQSKPLEVAPATKSGFAIGLVSYATTTLYLLKRVK